MSSKILKFFGNPKKRGDFFENLEKQRPFLPGWGSLYDSGSPLERQKPLEHVPFRRSLLSSFGSPGTAGASAVPLVEKSARHRDDHAFGTDHRSSVQPFLHHLGLPTRPTKSSWADLPALYAVMAALEHFRTSSAHRSEPKAG